MVERYNIKKIGIIFIIIMIFSTSVFGDSDYKNRVYDDANLITDEEEKLLNEKLEKYSKKRKADIIIVTSDEVYDKGHRRFNEDFYDKTFGYNVPVVMLSINMETRDVSVLGFASTQKRMDDNRAAKIRKKITPDLSGGNFNKAFNDFADTSYRYLGIRGGVNPDGIFFSNIFLLALSLLLAGAYIAYLRRDVSGKVTVNEKTYRDIQNTRVLDEQDVYVRTSVSKTRIQSNNSSSGGGSSGGGTTSGGTSYSGSSGKF